MAWCSQWPNLAKVFWHSSLITPDRLEIALLFYCFNIILPYKLDINKKKKRHGSQRKPITLLNRITFEKYITWLKNEILTSARQFNSAHAISSEHRHYAISFICEFAVWRCEIKPSHRLCLRVLKLVVFCGLAFNESKWKCNELLQNSNLYLAAAINWMDISPDPPLRKSTRVLSFLTTSHGTDRFLRSAQTLTGRYDSSDITPGLLRTCLRYDPSSF